MQLIAYAHTRSVRKIQRGFEPKRFGVLIAAEFAPTAVKFARHTDHVFVLPAQIRNHCREIIVTPTARRQRFEFYLVVYVDILLRAYMVRNVMYDLSIRTYALDYGIYLFEVTHIYFVVYDLRLFFVFWV